MFPKGLCGSDQFTLKLYHRILDYRIGIAILSMFSYRDVSGKKCHCGADLAFVNGGFIIVLKVYNS